MNHEQGSRKSEVGPGLEVLRTTRVSPGSPRRLVRANNHSPQHPAHPTPNSLTPNSCLVPYLTKYCVVPHTGGMNTIQRTIEIDPSRRLRLDLSLQETVPDGGIRFEITLVLPSKDERKAKYQAARRKLRELCRDSSLSVERFLAMKQAGRALETAQDERLFAGSGMP